MNAPPLQPELGKNTLTLYGELLCLPIRWPGQLVYAAFSGAARTGLSAAASLVGAAALIVDADPDAVRSHSRDGAFDFVVNSLDEALRTLKNEIRQHRPLAVALLADPEEVTAEAAERGLAPRLNLSGPSPSPELPGEDEMIRLRWSDPLRPSPRLHAWLRDHNWSPLAIPRPQPGAPTTSSPMEVLQPGDTVRSTWLRHLSTYQRSVKTAPSLWLWLSPEEQRLFDPHETPRPPDL